jgi:hypothetical protein
MRSRWPRHLCLAVILSLACQGAGDSDNAESPACEDAPATFAEWAEAYAIAECNKTDECDGPLEQEWIEKCIEDYVTSLLEDDCDYDCEAGACWLDWASEYTCETMYDDPPCASPCP